MGFSIAYAEWMVGEQARLFSHGGCGLRAGHGSHGEASDSPSQNSHQGQDERTFHQARLSAIQHRSSPLAATAKDTRVSLTHRPQPRRIVGKAPNPVE